jgi:hypothetical protein
VIPDKQKEQLIGRASVSFFRMLYSAVENSSRDLEPLLELDRDLRNLLQERWERVACHCPDCVASR